MGRAGNGHISDGQSEEQVRLLIPAHPMAVRGALTRIIGVLRLRGTSDEGLARAEIALAEILNNIVEHGYAGDEGPIAIRMRCGGDRACFVVSDRGVVMPGGDLPEGMLPEDGLLPEGGYGWFLVRSMAECLAYQRRARTNLTSFEVMLAE